MATSRDGKQATADQVTERSMSRKADSEQHHSPWLRAKQLVGKIVGRILQVQSWWLTLAAFAFALYPALVGRE